jgi:hypothetical protein
MKPFSHYLYENKVAKQYSFKIKVAGDLPEQFDKNLRTILEKYSCLSMSKSTTPVQKLPLDFPQHENTMVHIYEVAFEYPVISPVLRNYVSEALGIEPSKVVVRTEFEPSEEYQKLMDDRDNPAANPRNGKYDIMLMHPEMGDAESEKDSQNMVGEKHMMNFLKELSKEKHTLTQFKGVNDELLAKSEPHDSKIQEQSNKDADSKSPFANRKMPKPKGMR